MNLQLGLSLRILRVYLGRTYCVLFIQSRKESNRCNFGDTYLYPYLMKVLGDSSNVGYEYISLIEKNICDFLSRERLLLTSRSKDVSSSIASVIITPPPFSDVIAESHTPTVESENKCIHDSTRLTHTENSTQLKNSCMAIGHPIFRQKSWHLSVHRKLISPSVRPLDSIKICL